MSLSVCAHPTYLLSDNIITMIVFSENMPFGKVNWTKCHTCSLICNIYHKIVENSTSIIFPYFCLSVKNPINSHLSFLLFNIYTKVV